MSDSGGDREMGKGPDRAQAKDRAGKKKVAGAKSETATAADKCKSDEGEAGAWPGWECPAMQDWLNWNKK